MRQQVNVTVHLIYDADATLSAAKLAEAIAADVGRLTDADSESPVELCQFTLGDLKEEAAIYSRDEAEPFDHPADAMDTDISAHPFSGAISAGDY
jgi:hypothetical protein